MGSSNWSDNFYQARQKQKKDRGLDGTFAYTHDISSGKVRPGTHSEMNPYNVIRESRDSDEHPESNAIMVLFDVTGSMGEIPGELQKKLGKLMNVLLKGNYIDHPQIMFGAIGDANTDISPLQVGQFESGVEMDEDLEKLYLEGAGGGQVHETYEIGMYFASRKTDIDCVNKRGKKAYLFTMGDEKFYDKIKKEHVKQLIGDELTEDIDTKNFVQNELLDKFEYFHIITSGGHHGTDKTVINKWKDLLGERALVLDDPNSVCELIASTLGILEGNDFDEVSDDLSKYGTDNDTIRSVQNALKTVESKKVGDVDIKSDEDSTDVTML